MKLTFALIIVLAVHPAIAQEQVSKFGFQDAMLNMEFNMVPERFKQDCVTTRKDPSFVFCLSRADLGGIPAAVEITFRERRIFEIQASFPTEHFDVIWEALRTKYGPESHREPGLVHWLSNPQRLGLPVPDEVVLRRTPERPPKPDGAYYLPDVTYSLIEYQSLAGAREVVRKRQEERELRVREAAKKL
jgi:hypothetical protein